MKLLRVFIVGILIYSSIAAIAATREADYGRIKKDISVMAQIIKSAFEDEQACHNCSVQIDSSYLAKQGAVFTIKSHATFHGFVMPHLDQFDQVKVLEIEELVGNVLAGVGETLEEVGAQLEMRFSDDYNHDETYVSIQRETRNSVRRLNREVRELEYELREHEMELIHVEEDVRKQLEQEVKKLEEHISEAKVRRDTVNDKYQEKQKVRRKSLQAKREAKAKAELNRLEKVQNTVIQAFCDYGSTLKNLPDDEYISIIIKRRKQDGDAVFILRKDHIDSCTDGAALEQKALSYLY